MFLPAVFARFMFCRAEFRTADITLFIVVVVGMTCRRNKLLYCKYIAAERTFASFCQSIRSTGWRHSLHRDGFMTDGADCFCLFCAAVCTGIGQNSCQSTGRRGCYFAVVPAVIGSLCMCFVVSADALMLQIADPDPSAVIVIQSGNRIGFDSISARTYINTVAVSQTGWRYNGLGIVMTDRNKRPVIFLRVSRSG